ncbi:MAG: hypothetical protein M1833_006089 [Piccolia ochrophora]|nr:MAG: hypothetical protein M1833_006089 [Piccolia ochrophora]
MSANIISLALELNVMIFSYLDLADIRAVRRTCRAIAVKSRARFRQLIQPTQTDLSPTSLRTLLEPAFCDLIQELVVKATVYELSKVPEAPESWPGEARSMFSLEDVAQARADKEVLRLRREEQVDAQAAGTDLSMLARLFCQLGTLQALTIEVAVYQGPRHRLPAQTCTKWSPVWEEGTLTMKTVMAALAQSRLTTRCLKGYGHPWRCSVLTNDLGDVIQQNNEKSGLAEALADVRNLSLCISNRADECHSWEGKRRYASDEAVVAGPANLIGLSPRLEELFLHYYDLPGGNISYAAIFTQIGKIGQLACLRRCTLRGFRVNEDAMIEFLLHCPALEALTLEWIRLEQGLWRPIFDLISSRLPPIEWLSVNRLLQRKPLLSDHEAVRYQTLQFDHEDGLPHFDCLGARYEPTFDRQAIRNGIGFYPQRGRPKGSYKSYRDMDTRRLEYGNATDKHLLD